MTAKQIQEATRGLTLLYAEDEAEIREQTLAFLSKFFPSVDAVADGAEGLLCFEKKQHDIIISDLKMPKTGGEVLLFEAKKTNPATVTVAMSGISGGDENHPLQCDYFLKKPATTQMLVKLLETIITEHFSQ